jgi:hypothetical protein
MTVETFQVVDNPQVSEVYAGRLVGSAFDGSAVHLTFGSLRSMDGKSDSAKVYVTTRLALSLQAANELVRHLTQMGQALAQDRTQKPGANLI